MGDWPKTELLKSAAKINGFSTEAASPERTPPGESRPKQGVGRKGAPTDGNLPPFCALSPALGTGFLLCFRIRLSDYHGKRK